MTVWSYWHFFKSRMRLSPKQLWVSLTRYRITRFGTYWLVLALLLLFVGWSKSVNLLIVLAYLMLSLLLLNVVLSGRGLSGLRAERHFDGPIFVASPFAFGVTLSNLEARPMVGVRLEQAEMPEVIIWFLLHAPGGAAERLTRDVTLPRRGWHYGGPLTVVRGLPFGLAECRQKLLPEESVLVWARLGQLHLGRLRRWLRYESPREECQRLAGRPSRAARQEFHGLRPMRSGDSPRWIHWRTSARRNELMVREFEDTLGEDLTVIVEPCAAGERLEDVVSLAATVCWEWCRQRGRRLLLAVAAPHPVVCRGDTGPETAALTQEALALVHGIGEPGVELLIGRLRHERLPAGAVMLIAARPTPLRDRLAEGLRRSIACVTVDDLDGCDFYERPAAHDP